MLLATPPPIEAQQQQLQLQVGQMRDDMILSYGLLLTALTSIHHIQSLIHIHSINHSPIHPITHSHPSIQSHPYPSNQSPFHPSIQSLTHIHSCYHSSTSCSMSDSLLSAGSWKEESSMDKLIHQSTDRHPHLHPHHPHAAYTTTTGVPSTALRQHDPASPPMAIPNNATIRHSSNNNSSSHPSSSDRYLDFSAPFHHHRSKAGPQPIISQLTQAINSNSGGGGGGGGHTTSSSSSHSESNSYSSGGSLQSTPPFTLQQHLNSMVGHNCVYHPSIYLLFIHMALLEHYLMHS